VASRATAATPSVADLRLFLTGNSPQSGESWEVFFTKSVYYSRNRTAIAPSDHRNKSKSQSNQLWLSSETFLPTPARWSVLATSFTGRGGAADGDENLSFNGGPL
jgi:hypothetical protein